MWFFFFFNMSIQKRGGGFELNASFSLGVFSLEDKKKRVGVAMIFKEININFGVKMLIIMRCALEKKSLT
jgi:hypothetical protein